VDDEPRVLEGLALHLHRRFDVVTAPDGATALGVLQEDTTIAVVMSDMRMPGMDGAAFLSQAQKIVPDAVRLLLTGQADLDSAINAVNQGQVFRFLTKPCPTPVLLAALGAAADQHRLLTSERVLLEQTLHGCIKALTDILAMADPVSFGRAQRIKQCATDLARELDLPDRWQLEVAAMLSQLGWITLPPETVQKLHAGGNLSDLEQQMVARLPSVTVDLIGGIPRLEGVRGILSIFTKPAPVTYGMSAQDAAIRRGAQILRVAVDFDDLEARGAGASIALDTMRGRGARYEARVLDVLEATHVVRNGQDEIRELPLSSLRVGMILAEDVRLVAGPILVARGYEVTERFVERARNFAGDSIIQPVRVVIRHAGATPAVAASPVR